MDYTKYSGKPLVLGILSLVLSLVAFTSIPAFILGVIGTIIGYKARAVSGSAGFILSVIGLSISSVIMLITLSLFSISGPFCF